LGVGEKEFRIEDFAVVNEDVQLGSKYDLTDSLNNLAHKHEIFGQYDVALFRRAWRSMKKSSVRGIPLPSLPATIWRLYIKRSVSNDENNLPDCKCHG
jgi:hypothetical protein